MENHSAFATSKKVTSILLIFGCCVLVFEYKIIRKFGTVEIKRSENVKSGQDRREATGQQVSVLRLPSNVRNHASGNPNKQSFADQLSTNYSHLEFPELVNVSVDLFLSQDYNLSKARWLTLMEARQQMRLEKINFFCEKYNIRKMSVTDFVVRKPFRHSLYANDQHKMVLGLVLKVASSHFKKVLKQFGGSKRLYTLPNEKCTNRLENYFKVLFVRHPLARTLSAYRDKFVDHHISHFVDIGRRIIGSQRKGATPLEVKKATDVTFPEFIKYTTKGPKTRSNGHWDLMWHHNRVCALRYDFIGKLETIGDDFAYMVHKMSKGKLNASQYHLMKAYRSYRGDHDKLRAYYRNVSTALLKIWYDIYRRDFELFDYSMNILGPDIWPFQEGYRNKFIRKFPK